MDNDIRDSWKLKAKRYRFGHCPPKNWREPVTIEEQDLKLPEAGTLALVELLGNRLNLVMTRDDKRKKFYLGPADGKPGSSSTSPSGAKEPSPSLPSTGPSGGVRYPSGWTTESDSVTFGYVVRDSEAGSAYKAVDLAAAAPLVAAFPDAQLSKNFRLSEFRPGKHSYKFIRIAPALISALEEIRAEAGEAVHVTSGYRPPDYNREVGGVSNSCHIDGLAADIYCDGLSTDALYDICLKVIGPRGGVGYYPKSGFIHVDLRGYEARRSGS